MKKILTLFFIAVVIFFHSVCVAQPYTIALEAGAKDFDAALHIKLEKGWKIYAPESLSRGADTLCTTASSVFTFEGSTNIADVKVAWPAPKKYKDDRGKCQFFGYEGDVIIPVHITADDPTQSVHIEADFRSVACAGLCVPIHEKFSLTVGDNALSFWILMGALLGGFILNFMPCVLPVLSLKIIHLTHYQHAPLATIRRSFSLTALGIWVSFLLLALAAIALKETGQHVGWGMHFQNPYVVNGMMVIVALFAANLWGLFDIGVPAWINHFLPKNTSHSSKSDFFNGVLATLLATPCSAPFVGTALSVALSQGALEILLIFFMMGVGLSMPYIVLAITPRLATLLPRPGQWMIRLTRILAVGLLATTLWLLFIIGQHQDAVWSALGIGIIALVIVCFSKGQHGTSFKKLLNRTGTLLLMTAILMPLWSLKEDNSLLKGLTSQNPTMELWIPFNEQAIAQHVSDGRVVIVDITADWCLTCMVNKKLVLTNAQVTGYLASTHVVGMRGDWTKQDDTIAQFLKKYGRYGIPFNIIFGPKAPQGILLSEILTEAAVEEALLQAGARSLQYELSAP